MTDYKKYINALRKCAKEHENDRTFTGHIIVADLCRDTANLLEDLEQEPKTGHWIEIDEEPHEVWECDHCGFVIDGSGCIDPYDYIDTYKYCPNCGCRMVEPQESVE